MTLWHFVNKPWFLVTTTFVSFWSDNKCFSLMLLWHPILKVFLTLQWSHVPEGHDCGLLNRHLHLFKKTTFWGSTKGMIIAFFVINIDLLQNSVVTFLRQDDSGMRLRYTLVNIREDINRKRTCDLNTRESVEILFSAVLLPLHLLRSSPWGMNKEEVV